MSGDLEEAPSSYAGEQRLLVAVITAALSEARAGKDDAIRFLTEENGAWAEARRSWLAFTSLDDELIRKQCVRRFGRIPDGPRPCRAGSRMAQVIDLLAERPMSFRELVAALECSPSQLTTALNGVEGRGYRLVGLNGKIELRYPEGYDRPVPHKQ